MHFIAISNATIETTQGRMIEVEYLNLTKGGYIEGQSLKHVRLHKDNVKAVYVIFYNHHSKETKDNTLKQFIDQNINVVNVTR